MKIRKVTRGTGKWNISIDKQMYKHLGLTPGFEYVWVFLEPDGSLRIKKVEDVNLARKEEEKR